MQKVIIEKWIKLNLIKKCNGPLKYSYDYNVTFKNELCIIIKKHKELRSR